MFTAFAASAAQVTWEGSRRVLLLTAALARAANFALISVIARYLSDQGLGPAAIGVVLAAAGFTTAASQALWASLLTRSVASAGALAAALATFGCVSLGVTRNVVALVVSDVLLSAGSIGLSTAVRTVAGSGVEDQAESESRFGRITSFQTVGGFVGPLLIGWVVLSSSAAAPWFAAALYAAILTMWLRLLSRGRAGRPSTLGWRNAVRARSTRAIAAEADRADPLTGYNLSVRRTRQLVRSLRLVLICTVGTSFLYGANVVLWGLYLKDLGASAAVTAWSFALFSAPMVLIAPRAGRLWRNVPRNAAVVIGSASLGVMAIIYATVRTAPLAVGLTLVEGSLMALTMPIMASQVSMAVSDEDTARGFALLGAVDTTSAVIGTALGGVLVLLTGIPSTWYICGGTCIACAAGAWLSAESHRRAGVRSGSHPHHPFQSSEATWRS